MYCDSNGKFHYVLTYCLDCQVCMKFVLLLVVYPCSCFNISIILQFFPLAVVDLRLEVVAKFETGSYTSPNYRTSFTDYRQIGVVALARTKSPRSWRKYFNVFLFCFLFTLTSTLQDLGELCLGMCHETFFWISNQPTTGKFAKYLYWNSV